MKYKVFSGIMLTLLLLGMLTLGFSIQRVKAWTGKTIYINVDGSVDPSDAPISSIDNVTYTLTDNIVNLEFWGIMIYRHNIVFDGAGYAIKGTASSTTGIQLGYTKNVTIKNVEINAFGIGIYASYSSNSSIYGNNITANTLGGIDLIICTDNTVFGNSIAGYKCGINLYKSADSSIYGNNITANTEQGIRIKSSGHTKVYGNNITDNYSGIDADQSSSTSIYGNNIANNQFGINLLWSSSSLIYHNNFVDNTNQVSVAGGSANVWDYGYPSGGNYWSDYTYEDWQSGPFQNLAGSDGIWDHAYVIDADNKDNYPLVNPWPPKPFTSTEALGKLIETIETVDLPHLPKGTKRSLISKLNDAIHLLDIGNENGAIHKLLDFISRVETLRGKKLTNFQADYLTVEANKIINLIG